MSLLTIVSESSYMGAKDSPWDGSTEAPTSVYLVREVNQKYFPTSAVTTNVDHTLLTDGILIALAVFTISAVFVVALNIYRRRRMRLSITQGNVAGTGVYQPTTKICPLQKNHPKGFQSLFILSNSSKHRLIGDGQWKSLSLLLPQEDV